MKAPLTKNLTGKELLAAYVSLQDVTLPKINRHCDFIKACTNCMYCNNCDNCTDCINCINCANCTKVHDSKHCTNCVDCEDCSCCISCNDTYHSYDCSHCTTCVSCYHCHWCTYMEACDNCLLCTGLQNKTKSYYILNKEVTKEEYDLTLKTLTLCELEGDF